MKWMPPVEECSTPHHQLIMNVIIWNCRGAMKPSFQSYIRELVRNQNPAMFVVMETKVGGDRAREITDRLPFDGAVHTNIIGYAGGLWLLWNSDRVEVTLLTTTEQEIHVTVKEWSMWNGKMKRSVLPGQPPWMMIFPFAIWNIWKSKNNVVFNRKNPNPRLAVDILAQTRKFMYCVCLSRGPTRYTAKEVRWERPPEG
ncbi:hypothetical protein ACB092_01G016900 [Castanea dentata]